jgi:hypothetical protein
LRGGDGGANGENHGVEPEDGQSILQASRKTVNRHYGLFREVILKASLRATAKEIGVFWADESYLGAKRMRVKRGENAGFWAVKA